MRHIHLIGIGGTGLSAIARVLIERGFHVSGSDLVASPLFKAITTAGAKTFLGHRAEQITGADIVIRSSAIPESNPEVQAAREQGIPVLKRADFLSELTQGKDTLAVAGTHGKTTTTSMLIWMLEKLDINPSFISGAVIKQLGCNARAGSGPYFVIEADEYDSMFLGLSPKIAVITNVEHDHPDCFPTETTYFNAFKAFLQRIRDDGLALICKDDPHARELMENMADSGMQLLSYGTGSDSTYQIGKIELSDGTPCFTLNFTDKNGSQETLGQVQLNIPGYHNILNATAALAVIHQLDLPMDSAVQALGNFMGTNRRFEILGTAQGITMIDDYGHHPTEISATLDAAHSRFPKERIWAIWQPHTYSRTQTLEEGYIRALSAADKVVVLKIYAAREADTGYSAETIAHALPEDKAHYIPDFPTATRFLLENLQAGDVAIIFSAGDAVAISKQVFDSLRKRHDQNGSSR